MSIHIKKHFYSITISAKCMHSIHVKPSRDEAYTTLNVKPPLLQRHGYMLRLKIDTGASGNTLPLCTFKQMYGASPQSMEYLKAAFNVKITSYTGDDPLLWNHHASTKSSMSLVDVSGPAVVGLPTSELLSLVTVNVDAMAKRETMDTRDDKQKRYPTTHKKHQSTKREIPRPI